MYCSRRLYKGNSYEICLPLIDTGVTLVRFYTRGDIIIEKEPEISGDSMCFNFTVEDLASLEDGVLRYGYDDFDTNSPYVVVTPGDYSGSTIEDIIADAFDSGYTAGQEDCSGGTCEGVWDSGYTSGYTDGQSECPGPKTDFIMYHAEKGDDGVYYGNNYIDFGKTWVPSSGYDGFDLVNVTCYFDTSDFYNSGYTDGLNACSGGSCEGIYESGYSAGREYQRSRLQAGTFTQNATYLSPTVGWSSVTVDVPKILEYPAFNITENGTQGFSPSSGYDGFGHVKLYVSVPDRYQSGYNSGHTDGYAEGLAACSSVTDADLIANLQGDYYVIPEGTTHLRNYALYRACFSSITIPTSVSAIGSYAFAYNTCLTNITIPDSVQSLEATVFQTCSNLQTVILGDGLSTLRSSTFASCGLTGITIPSGITEIESNCFKGCSDLIEMTFEGLTPPTINSGNSLGSTAYTFPIYVPCEAVEDYQTAFGEYYAPRITCAGPEPQSAATAITITVPQGLEPGDTGSTSVSTSPSGATTNLSYSSSDNSVATVDNNGNITAVGTGTTNICVTDSISQITECAQLTISNPGPGPQPSYSSMPLTFEIISGGTIGWNSQANIEIEYSVNCGSTWSTFNSPISVNAGDMVQFRGTGRTGTDSGDSNYSYFTTSGALFNACGNLYSLLDKTNYSAIDDLTQYGKNTFRGLFRGNTGLTSAENLIMKANTLSEACYYNMFRDCTKLTTSPELPARVLVTGCYWAMFEFCQSLRSIRCYAVENTTSTVNLSAWVTAVPSDGTFYKHPNATWNTGSEGIPYGWTVVDVQL